MKDLLRITKISAKEIVKKLQKSSPYFCSAINTNIFITKYFLNHIAYQKNRTEKEVIERLLIISFIEKIFKNGTLKETRKIKNETFYKISYTINKDTFCTIISTTKTGKYILTSCFREYKKRTLS